jgi:preprotein translocase subunit SecG
MLSFMREQGQEDSSPQKPLNTADSAEKAQEQEYLTVAAHNKNVRKSTMLLAALFAIGLLCLVFMIKKSTPQTATAGAANTEETQIETAITRLIGVRSEMFNRMDEIVKKFYEFSDVQQVNVSELVKNPFKRETFLGNLKKISDTKERGSDIDIEMMRRQQLRQQAKDMQLLSIMQSGQGNCCMIDNKILYEGDSIRGFSVKEIGDSFVKLEWDPKRNEGLSGTQPESIEIILKLSE